MIHSPFQLLISVQNDHKSVIFTLLLSAHDIRLCLFGSKRIKMGYAYSNNQQRMHTHNTLNVQVDTKAYQKTNTKMNDINHLWT